jgi:hypothetical protein
MPAFPDSSSGALIPEIRIGIAVDTVSTSFCSESRSPNWARQ